MRKAPARDHINLNETGGTYVYPNVHKKSKHAIPAAVVVGP